MINFYSKTWNSLTKLFNEETRDQNVLTKNTDLQSIFKSIFYEENPWAGHGRWTNADGSLCERDKQCRDQGSTAVEFVKLDVEDLSEDLAKEIDERLIPIHVAQYFLDRHIRSLDDLINLDDGKIESMQKEIQSEFKAVTRSKALKLVKEIRNKALPAAKEVRPNLPFSDQPIQTTEQSNQGPSHIPSESTPNNCSEQNKERGKKVDQDLENEIKKTCPVNYDKVAQYFLDRHIRSLDDLINLDGDMVESMQKEIQSEFNGVTRNKVWNIIVNIRKKAEIEFEGRNYSPSEWNNLYPTLKKSFRDTLISIDRICRLRCSFSSNGGMTKKGMNRLKDTHRIYQNKATELKNHLKLNEIQECLSAREEKTKQTEQQRESLNAKKDRPRLIYTDKLICYAYNPNTMEPAAILTFNVDFEPKIEGSSFLSPYLEALKKAGSISTNESLDPLIQDTEASFSSALHQDGI